MVGDPKTPLYRYAATTEHRYGGTIWDPTMVYQNVSDLVQYPHSFWATEIHEGFRRRDGQVRTLIHSTVGELEKVTVLALDGYEANAIILVDTHGRH